MYYEEWHPLYLANNSGKELEGREAEDFKKGMVFVKEQLSQVIALQDLVLEKENKIGDLEEKEKDLHAQLAVKEIDYKKLRDAVAYKDLEITRRELEVEHSKAGLEKEREILQSSDAAKLEDKLKTTEQELRDARQYAVEELDRTKGAYAKKVKNIVALQRIKYEKELCRVKKESSDLENKLIGLLSTNEPLYNLIGELRVNPEDIKAQPPSDEGKVRIQIVKSDDLKMATMPQNSKVIFYVDKGGTNPFIARGRLECGFVYFSLSDLITDEPDKAALVNLMLKDIAEGRKSAHIIPYSAEIIANILEKRISETKMPETEAVKRLKAKATAAENELTNLKKGSVAMMKYINSLNAKKTEEAVKEVKESYEAKIAALEVKDKPGDAAAPDVVINYILDLEKDLTEKMQKIEALEQICTKAGIAVEDLTKKAEPSDLKETTASEAAVPTGPVYVGVLDVPERGYCVQAKLPDGTEVTYRTDGLFVFSSDLIGTDSKPLNVPKEYIKILKQIWAEHRNDYIKKFHPESLNIEEATAPKVASPTPPAVVQDENYVYQFVDGFWSGKLVVHEVQQDKSLKYVGEYTAFGGVKNVKKIKGAEIKDLPKEVVSNIVNVYLKQMQSAKEMPIQLGDVSGVVRQQGEKIEILYKNLTYTVKDDALLDKDNNVVTEPGALKLFSAYRYQKSQESQERSWLEDALGI